MQNLIKLLEQLRSESPHLPSQELIHRVREYLQILVLKSIYHSNLGTGLSFMGGTCLRICHNLKRYSEDLDFALDRTTKNYSFDRLIGVIIKDLEAAGYKIETRTDPSTVVQKSFLKFSGLSQPLGLTARKGQKLHIKLEVDTHPIKVTGRQMESFFINKYNEIFPILKHRKETLFAGKLLAILLRTYAKGRDYYDLIWYLSQHTAIDMEYLRNGIVQANKSGRAQTSTPEFETAEEIFDYLGKIINKVDIAVILKDIERFLEDPKEEKWIKDYRRVFAQLAHSYLSK